MTEQSNETPLSPLPPQAPEEPGYLILPSMMDMDQSNFSLSTVNLSSPIPPSSLIPLSPLSPDGEDKTNTEPLPSFKTTPTYVALPSPGSSGPSSPSSLGVTLSELLKGAHTQIRYLDCQVKELNNKRVVFLRWLSKKDLEILTQDNMIKHLHHDLCSVMDHIQLIKQQLKEMSYTPQEDKCPQKVPHTHSTQQLTTPESGPHSHPLSPLVSSSMAPSPTKAILNLKPPHLCPNGYLWFTRPDSE